MLYKTTRSLFRGLYQYKIVLVCAGASMFRSEDWSATFEELKKINLNKNSLKYNAHIKSKDDLDYALNLANTLSRMQDLDVRVESPWISIYSNSKKDIDTLSKLDKLKVKYVSMPAPNSSLTENTIVMPKMNYEFRITLGKTNHENSSFISWAETNKKCKLTKSCIRDLQKTRSWGGTHFYITGENNLLLAKMHLGGSIAKVERIVKN